MVKKIVVVIGANYGDEGKGLASRYFALNNDDSQIVLFNGGPQRGHTVEKLDGFRHIFKHFGAGACDEIPTVFHRYFMINPMVFAEEYDDLTLRGYTIEPELYIDYECRVITPFDMILNQLVEKSRGDNRHGSCGHGIWETIVRYRSEGTLFNWTLGEMLDANDRQLYAYLTGIRDRYMKPKLLEYDIDINDYPSYRTWINSPGLITHYISDFHLMNGMAVHIYTDSFDYDETVIFEGGQGLLLDQDLIESWPNVTASRTGASQLLPFLRDHRDAEIEICYVTRPYLTRHGEGPMENESNHSPIFESDKTNVWNEFQGSLRYGALDISNLKERIRRDFEPIHLIVPNAKASIMMTQIKDYQCCFRNSKNFCGVINSLKKDYKVYLANTRYAEDVEVVK